MKRILLLTLFAVIALFSCSKDKQQIYQLFNNSDGNMYYVCILEYSGNDVVKEVNIEGDNLRTFEKGLKSDVFIAGERTDKVKISFKKYNDFVAYALGVSNPTYFTVSTFYLERGKLTTIEIVNSTKISTSRN